MNVTVFGAGYVGLVTGICLAEVGHQVMIMDTQEAKIVRLTEGLLPIFEPGLEPLLSKNLVSGTVQFTTDVQKAVDHGDVLMIAVGTPPLADGGANLDYVFAVANSIGQTMNAPKLVVDKSTVPVGTAEKVQLVIEQAAAAADCPVYDVDVVANPEFLREGSAVGDFMEPDRIIVGAERDDSIATMKALYAPLTAQNHPLLVMGKRSAELTKYAANALLATKISFMNEISQIARHYSADIKEVQHALGMDNRISPKFLDAGCGFGGSCFPKDLLALRTMANEKNYHANLLDAVLEVNKQQQELLFQKLSEFFKADFVGRRIAVWGLSFKPNTDDIRAATSCRLLDSLLEVGATVQAYDPLSMSAIAERYADSQHLLLCESADVALNAADVLVIVTEWDEFREPDFSKIRERLKYPVIFDGRNIYDPAKLHTHDLHYCGVGYGDAVPSIEDC